MRKLTFLFMFLLAFITFNDASAQITKEKESGQAKSSTLYKTITGTPLTIYVGDGGDYQVYHSVFGSNQVYSASAIPASGGLFAWYNGTSIGFSGAAMGTFRNWVPVSQADVVGTGTIADPFKVVTTFNDPTGISMTATTSYINGLDYFNVKWDISIPSVGNVTTFIAQDLMLGGSDAGYCYYDATTGAVGGMNAETAEASTQFQMYVPVSPAVSSAYSVQSYSTIWGLIGQNGIPGAGLGNEVATGLVDNGMGLQYNLTGASSYSVEAKWAFTADAGSVTGLPQQIVFGPLAQRTYGDAAFTVSATGGGSGNPVTFTSSDNNIATCTGTNGSTITIINAGSCYITAHQAGNDEYSPAPPVSQILIVNRAAQVITFPAILSKVLEDISFSLSATGGASGNPVTYTISDNTVATISGAEVTLLKLGTTYITAHQAGNANYFDATDVTNPLYVILIATNTITPNGDGINDKWTFPQAAGLDGYNLTIFNNLGATLYQSVGYDNTWDATFNGEPLPSGTYYYIFENGTYVFKGFITVIREKK